MNALLLATCPMRSKSLRARHPREHAPHLQILHSPLYFGRLATILLLGVNFRATCTAERVPRCKSKTVFTTPTSTWCPCHVLCSSQHALCVFLPRHADVQCWPRVRIASGHSWPWPVRRTVTYAYVLGRGRTPDVLNLRVPIP